MKDFFDVNEVLYQKFLLDIYRHCDKLDLNGISVEEKEKMALEMVDFVGKVINSLESKKPLIEIQKKDARAIKKISRFILEKAENDDFSRSVLKYYVSKKKIRQSEIDSYLTTAALAIMSRGGKTDLKKIESRIKNAKPYLFRVASLLSPAVRLHEKLFAKTGEETGDDFLIAGSENPFMKYID
jgi:hypothetical protein